VDPRDPLTQKVEKMDNTSSTAEVENNAEKKEVAEDFDPSVVIFACRH
jgi:hypothetical protein